MNKRKKGLILLSLILTMIFYVGWVFYVSEPQFINNVEKDVEVYDYISLPDYKFSSDIHQPVVNGIVLQTDKNFALVKIVDGAFNRDKLYELNLLSTKYRIIGRGTFYHKINNYVGFNIMMITQVIILLLIVVLCTTTGKLVTDMFDDYLS